jgi:hypothetical protein
MSLNTKTIIAVFAFALGASSANAATYNLDEIISGQWNFVSPDNYSYSYGAGTFISGDSLLLNLGTTATAAYAPGTFNCISCSYTSSLLGGGSVFGSFTVDSSAFVVNGSNPSQVDLNFFDTFTIDGGTGVFAGASGGGTLTGTHFGALLAGIPQASGPSTEHVTFSLTTAPVPEPETYAMVLAGLGLIGFKARRGKRKNPA